MAANLRPAARTKTIPAPLGGWNTRDSLALMEPTDAVILDNWWPRTSDMINRRGSSVWATGLAHPVNTLMTYAIPTGQLMFAAAGVGIYDVSTQGAVGAAVVTGLGSTAFQYTNMNTAGGSFLYAVNGVDDALLYDGTTWTAINTLSTPAITGIATSTFKQVNLWKRRLFFVEKESMSVWYLPVNSIGGIASEINFGSLFKKGGKIIATATWTVDAGYGADDNLVVITNRGEVAVYTGTDPANAATFSLIGVFELGSPVSDRCFVKYAGDLLIITLDGIVPMSKALSSTRVDNRVAISDKISGAMTDATTQYQFNFGWQGILFPKVNMLLFNIPVRESEESWQFVMNTLTGAWARFTNWNANAFELFNDDLYFGGDGAVYKAWDGWDDLGGNIVADVKQAFNYFDAPAQLKHWKMARPIFFANRPPPFQINLDIDFDNQQIFSQPTTDVSSVAIWDNNTWDNANWNGQNIYKYWQSLAKLGYCAGLRMVVTGNGLDVTWPSTDFLYEYGGVL